LPSEIVRISDAFTSRRESGEQRARGLCRLAFNAKKRSQMD
jgi:hypothetical protein